MSDNDTPRLGKVQSGDIYQVFRDLDDPVLSTSEFNNHIDFASRSTIYRKLTEMEKNGTLETKKAGSGDQAGRVWYPPDELPDIPEPTPKLKRITYRNPGLSIMVLGFIAIGIGFLFYVPGQFGEGDYLGLINRDWLVVSSIVTASVGLAMIYLGGGWVIGRNLYSYLASKYST